MTHPRSISDRLLPKGRKKGESFVSRTKTLKKALLFSVKPFQYRGKVWIGVDVSLLLSLRQSARPMVACYQRDARK